MTRQWLLPVLLQQSGGARPPDRHCWAQIGTATTDFVLMPTFFHIIRRRLSIEVFSCGIDIAPRFFTGKRILSGGIFLHTEELFTLSYLYSHIILCPVCPNPLIGWDEQHYICQQCLLAVARISRQYKVCTHSSPLSVLLEFIVMDQVNPAALAVGRWPQLSTPS